MNGLSIFFLLLIILFAIILFLGVVFLVVGFLKKDVKNSLIKLGLKFISFPIGIVLIYLLYEFSREHFTVKPSERDLVGVYHITQADGLIPKEIYSSFKLEFKTDGTFYLTPVPNINICESGKFSVDWQFSLNELSFQCDKGFTPAHIDRGFTGYRIEFIVGDPDEGQGIYFSKDK